MTLRRVLAALAGCVLVMSGLVAPSGAVAAPSVPDPVASVEPMAGEVAASSSDELAVSEDEADEPKPSDDEAKKPEPKAAADEGKKPAAAPKAADDEKSDEVTSGGSSGSSTDKAKTSTDDETTKPSTSDDEPSDEPKASDPEDDATPGGVKHSGGGKATLPTDDDDAPSDDDAASKGDSDQTNADDEGKPADADEAASTAADEVRVPAAPVRVTAAGAALGSISATIVEDGNEKSTDDAPISFEVHGPVMAADGSYLDETPHNGIVAANDSVIYSITAGQVNTPGTQKMVAVLPQGMEWAASAAAVNGGRCDEGAARSNGNRELTCSWTNDGSSQNYTIQARAWVGSVANGAVVAPIFYDSSTSGASFAGPVVQVVAETRTEIRLYTDNSDQNITYQNDPYKDVLGVRFRLWVGQGTTSPSGDVRGLEALTPEFTYVLDMPDGAVAYSPTISGGGSIATSQPGGPGGDVTVTITGASTNFLKAWASAGRPATWLSASSQTMYVFVPYDPWIPPGATTYLVGEVTGFDPDGLSGSSNFGTGVAPGQDGLPACPTSGAATGSQLHCFRVGFTRSASNVASVSPTTVGARAGHSVSTNLFGDGHGYSQGQEKLVPGQRFWGTVGMYSSQSSAVDAVGLFGCAAWNRAQLELTGSVVAVRSTAANAGATAFYAGQGTVLGSASYVLEYASLGLADDAARKAFACGLAGDGDPLWSTAPAASSDAVRVRFVNNAEPGRAFGLRLPFARTAMALPVNTPLPWFWQYGRNNDPTTTVLSNYDPKTAAANQTKESARGGTVQAVPALVRANTAWSVGSAGNGEVVGLTLSPSVVGPTAGPDTVALNTKLRVSLSSTCVSPVVESLPSYAVLTPADYGPDGVPCTGDDGAPASILFELGDVPAVSGPRNPLYHSSVGGHEVLLPQITFQVAVSPLAADQSSVTATTVISSDSDKSPANQANNTGADRTSAASLVVAASESFKGSKTASTQEPGVVGPGEEFSYTIGFANTMKVDFLPGVFVDVLPFAGDPRLESSELDGLANGGESLTLLDVQASMITASMGDVNIYYSSADPAMTYPTLATQPDGSDPSFGWQPWPPAGGLASVKALRFVTSDGLASGHGGSATISLRAGALSVGGVIRNDVFGAVPRDPASVPLMDDQTFLGSIRHRLTSSAAEFAGTVQRDTDFDSATVDSVDANNDSWWPAGGVVELVEAGVVKYTAPITSGGAFDVGIVAAGTYVVRVKDASGWTTLAGGTVTIEAGDETSDHRLVVQEIVPDPVLVNDTAKTGVGGTVTIDVTANDTLAEPSVSTVTPAQLVLKGSGTTANGGTYVVSSSPSGVYAGQPQVTFTASGSWPAGESGLSYTETFEYSWTNVVGVEKTSTVTVTVQKGPSASDGTARIPVDGSHTFDADPQTYGTITSASVKDGPSQGTVTADTAGNVTFDGTGADPGGYTFTVEWTDDLGQKCVSEYTVTVQAPPTASGGTAKIPVGGSYTFDADPQPKATIVSASVKGDGPSQGTASVDHATGMVTFDGTGAEPGEYTFDVEWEDDLGQTCTSTYTVTVQAPPTASGGTAKIPVDGSHTFEADPQTRETIVSASVTTGPSQGSVSVDHTTGEVTFDGTGVEPGEYTFEVTWVDDLDQTCVSEYTVVVQAAPTATGGTVTIPENGSHTFDAELTGSVVSASVTKAPSHGTVTVNHATGEVSFDGAGVADGTYTFEVTWIDDVGQYCTSTYTVTVRSLKVTGDPETRLGTGEMKSHYPVVNHPDHVVSVTFLSLPAQGTVTYDPVTGEVRYVAGDRAGIFTYELEWTDDLGQTARLFHTVIVEERYVPPPPPSPTPTTPTPTPPTPVPTTPTPSPTETTDPPVVGTGGTVSGGGPSGLAVVALTVAAIVLFSGAFLLRRRNEDVGR